MSLSDALAKSQATTRKPSLIETLLATLDEADRDTLRTALLDPEYTISSIGRALRSQGHAIADGRLSEYRRNNS